MTQGTTQKNVNPDGEGTEGPVEVPLQVQECSFVKWNVSGISSTAASPCGKYIAVARTNRDIELKYRPLFWATTSVVYTDQYAPTAVVSAMEFSSCSRYLFIAYLTGMLRIFRITEDGLVQHTNMHPGGGAIWDLSVQRSDVVSTVRVALASDDGCVRMLSPDPNFMNADDPNPLPIDPTHYEIKTSEKCMARALAVEWAPVSAPGDDDCIACGDDQGGIRWLNARTGSSFGKGKIPKVGKQPVMIWTLKFARGGQQVVCGDSRGMATVWSSMTKTLTGEIAVEGITGQLWSSAVSFEDPNNEMIVFGSAGGGVGGLRYTENKWMPIRAVQLHTHDVRGVSCLPNGQIVTGSLDALIRIFKPSKLISKKDIPFIRPHTGCVGQAAVQICAAHNMIVSRLHSSVEIWSVPSTRKSPSLRLRLNLKSFVSEIRACALSADSCFFAVSAAESFRIYRVWDGKGDVETAQSFGSVKLLPTIPEQEKLLSGSMDMAFSGHILVCISVDRKRLMILKGNEIRCFKVEELTGGDWFLNRIVCNEKVIAVSDSRGNVCYCPSESLFSTETSQWKVVSQHGKREALPVTALALSGSGQSLALTASTKQIWTINLRNGKVQPRNVTIPRESTVQNLSFSVSATSLLVSGQEFCGIMEMKPLKRKRGEDKPRKALHMLIPYKDSIIGSGVLGPSHVAIVRRSWDKVLPSLPDAIAKRMFGS